jgi:hypothetical protein
MNLRLFESTKLTKQASNKHSNNQQNTLLHSINKTYKKAFEKIYYHNPHIPSQRATGPSNNILSKSKACFSHPQIIPNFTQLYHYKCDTGLKLGFS